MSSKLGLSAGRPSETNKERLIRAVQQTDTPAPPTGSPAPKVAPKDDDGEGEVRINFECKKSLHRRVKLYSVTTGMSIRDIMTDLIEKHIPDA
jgi:hypothetical protein